MLHESCLFPAILLHDFTPHEARPTCINPYPISELVESLQSRTTTSNMAYGKVRGIPKPLGDVPARIYPIESNASETRAAILTVPVDFNAGDSLDGELVKKLQEDFNEWALDNPLKKSFHAD